MFIQDLMLSVWGLLKSMTAYKGWTEIILYYIIKPMAMTERSNMIYRSKSVKDSGNFIK